MDEKKLSMIVCGGWNSKIGPGALSGLLDDLPKKKDENLIVGYESSDDAAVYKIWYFGYLFLLFFRKFFCNALIVNI